jgi:hypothetical protein
MTLGGPLAFKSLGTITAMVVSSSLTTNLAPGGPVSINRVTSSAVMSGP